MADRILTPSELATALRVSVATIEALVRDGLPAIDLGGGQRRFLWSDTMNWLRSRLVPSQQPRAQ